MTIRALGVIGLVALAACSGGPAPGQRAEVEVARQRWEARSFQDYAFETSTSCFCPPEINRRVRVEVRNDQVVAVTLVETGNPVQSPLSYWFTIDELFDRILQMVDGEGEFELEFDPELGYPSLVNSIAPPGLADGGSLTLVFTMEAMP